MVGTGGSGSANMADLNFVNARHNNSIDLRAKQGLSGYLKKGLF
jgi:hypothetical protein